MSIKITDLRKYSILLFICVSFIGCNKSVQNNNKSQGKNDSIIYSVDKDGIKTKTIYYPLKKEDSFRLKANYLNNKLIDSGYVSKNGFIKGNFFFFNNDSVRTVYEYLNIHGSSTVNQYWVIKGQDTLSNNGNFYKIRIFDSIKKNKLVQIQIALAMPYEENFSDVFFLRPKKGFDLKSDFSNYKEIEYDTFKSIINNLPKKNKFYDKYWSKRIVPWRESFKKTGENYIKGILVERTDSLSDKSKYESKERYLFVNKKITVEN